MEDIDIKMESKIMFKINDEKIENSIITILETIAEIIFLMIMLFDFRNAFLEYFYI